MAVYSSSFPYPVAFQLLAVVVAAAAGRPWPSNFAENYVRFPIVMLTSHQ